MKSYIEVSTRYLKLHKKRTVLSIVGIVMAAALICAIGTMIFSYQESNIREVKKNAGDFEVAFKRLSGEQVDEIKKHVDFKDVAVVQDIGFSLPDELSGNKGAGKKFLYIRAYDNEYITKVLPFDVIEGKLPKKENELAIEKDALRYMYKDLKVGDKIKLTVGNRINMAAKKEIKDVCNYEYSLEDIEGFEVKFEKEYKLVGIVKSNDFFTGKINYRGITYLNKIDEKDKNYNAYMKVVSSKNKREISYNAANKMSLQIKETDESSPQVSFNEELLKFYAQSGNLVKDKMIVNVLIFIISVIVASTIAVIYNSFNISVLERIAQFGILRSIGATPKQIRKIVFKEAAIISFIAIPFGLFLGVFSMKLVVLILGGLSFIPISDFKVGIYPLVLLISGFLGVFTVFLSALFPARMAGRVSPLDAVRNTGNIKKERFKRVRKGRLFKLLFKFEGQLAYKNMRRNRKRFAITVFALVISIVMFITFSSFLYFVDTMNKKDAPKYYNAIYQSRELPSQEDYYEIKSLQGIDRVYKEMQSWIYWGIPKEKLNNNYIKDGNIKAEELLGTAELKEFQGAIYGYGEEELKVCKDHIVSGKVDKRDLDNMGVILINRCRTYSNGKSVIGDFTSYKIGDVIKIPRVIYEKDGYTQDKLKKAINNNEFYNLKIVGILDVPPLFSLTLDRMTLITSEKTYEKITGNKQFSRLALKINDNADREKLKSFFQAKNEKAGGDYTDFKENNDREKETEFQVSVFIYGFIIVIAIIGAINIFNTISTNLLLRKREFAMMKAIGMHQHQLRRLVFLEGILQGLIAAMFGSAIGIVLSYILYKLIIPAMEIPWVMPWKGIIIASTSSIALTLLASIWPLKKINESNIMESIRIEE